MRSLKAMGLVVVLAISLMTLGTTWAQDDTGDETTGIAWLGIQFSESEAGVVVERVVNDSPADAAGLARGDVFISIDDEAVDSADALSDLVLAHAPGDVITVVVDRDGSEEMLEVTLGDTSEYDASSARPLNRRGDDTLDSVKYTERALGVDLEAVDGGYQVTDINSHTRFKDDGVDDTEAAEDDADTTEDEAAAEDEADEAGAATETTATTSESVFQVGDVITAINGVSIDELDWAALADELSAMDEPTLSVSVTRDGEAITVVSDVSSRLFGDPHQDNFDGRGGRGSSDNSGGGRPPQHGHGGDDSSSGDDSGTSESSDTIET